MAQQTFHAHISIREGREWLLLGQPYDDGYWLLGIAAAAGGQPAKTPRLVTAESPVQAGIQAADLRHALYFTPASIAVTAQPVCNLDTGGITGASLCASWQHPLHAEVSGPALLQLAAQAEVLQPLFTHLLTIGASCLREWQQYRPDMTVSLPVSDRLLAGTLLLRVLNSVVQQQDIDPDSILLDCDLAQVTEIALNQLQQLRAQGYQVSIRVDATALADLLSLECVPATRLCFSQAFVRQLHSGSVASELVSLLAKLSEHGRRTLCAIGVSSPADATLLRQAGCTLGQGALFGKPIGADDFTSLLEAFAPASPALPKTA